KPARVLPVRIAAHGRLIDGDLSAPGADAALDFLSNYRDKRLGNSPPVWILRIRNETATEGVWPRNADLQSWTMGRNTAEPLELRDNAKPGGGRKISGDLMLTALIVSRRTKTPRRRRLSADPLQKSIEGQIEI